MYKISSLYYIHFPMSSFYVLGFLHLLYSSRRIWDDLPITTSRLSRPARFEQWTQLEAWESVGFGIDNDLIEGKKIIGREEEVEVLQRLGLGVSVSL